MKEGIHPNYREVCFVDLSNGFKFVTRSCVNAKETVKMDDGRELPLFKLDTSSESHRSIPAPRNRSTTWVVASRNSATATPKNPPPEAGVTCGRCKQSSPQAALFFCAPVVCRASPNRIAFS